MIYDINDGTVQCVDEIVRELEATGDYRVLQRLIPHDAFMKIPADQPTEIAIVLDVETTGLDSRTDQVIELAMIKFAHTTDGHVVRVLETFNEFNEPTVPITKEITNITGITDDMVAGHHIDPVKISSFLSGTSGSPGATLILAHNAQFDRPFTESKFSEFQYFRWGCSQTQLAWRDLGFDGMRLTHLLAHIGKFYKAHRALDDCRALLELLAYELPNKKTTILKLLIDEVGKKTVRIFAEGAPYELKETLKRRKYKWSDGSDGRPRSWYVDVDEKLQQDEVNFLRKEIYRRDVDLNIQVMDAFVRFSNRI